MPPRSRERNHYIQQGTRYLLGGPDGGHNNLRSSACVQVNTDKGDCHDFTNNKWFMEGGIINKESTGYYDSGFTNYICNYAEAESWGHLNVTGVPSNSTSALRGVNATNPNRPYVDVPVAVFELAEIASLIRTSGKRLIERIGSTNLRYQFGVAPLISDVDKLLQFTQFVDQRIAELERLLGPRGLRRTVELGTWEATRTEAKYLQSQGTLINVNVRTHTQVTVRVHCRWEPVLGTWATLKSPSKRRAIAMRALKGSTIDIATIWELIPWSWLIDWCSNIGLLMQANRNLVPAQLTTCQVMKHTKTSYRTPHYSSGGVTCTPIWATRETMTRDPGIVIPSAHFPFLSGKQMGILGSLAVTRRR